MSSETRPSSPKAPLLENSFVRLLAALFVALIGYIIISAYFVNSYSAQIYDLRRQELQRLVEVGLHTIAPLREQQARGELSPEEALADATALVRRMTYSQPLGDNYLFMSRYDGTMLVQPFEPELEGTNQWDLRDANGKPIIQSLVATATGPAGAGYVEYDYPPPGDTAPQRKVSYVVGIPEWGVYIGTGMYVGDVTAESRTYMRNMLLLSGGLALVIGLVVIAALQPVISSQRTLLNLFRRVSRNPEDTPAVPVDHFRRGSEGWQLLAGFREMLQQIQRARAKLQESEERFDLAVQGTNDGIWDWDLDADEVYYSPRWKSMLGYAADEVDNHLDAWRDLVHPDDRERAEASIAAHLRGETPLYQLEHRLRHKDGSYRWILARGRALRDEQGRPYRMVGSHTDVTARRRDAEIQAGQQQFLELLATGGTLFETLDRLIRVIEEQSPGMLGLILLLDEDGKHLHIGAGPNLSPEYLDSIEGLEIGPMVGSCGTASYTGERVIVTDIATDPRWDNLRELALDSGLRACWSEPVFSPHGQVIGTFAMYYRQPRTPTAAELKTISTGAHLAGVAIERRRADQALQESERRLATLMSNLPGMAYSGRYDRELSKTFVSEGSSALTGYLPGDLVGDTGPAYITLIHEDDRARVWDEVRAAVEQEQPYQMTYRIRTAAGDEKWVWEQGRAVRRDNGSVQALEGFITDITERVQAQQMLEQRVAERTRELSTLLDVTHNVSSTLELQPLLRVILDQLKAVVDYDGASVLVLEDDMLQLVAYRGPIAQENALNIRFALADAGANRAVIEQCQPLAIGDVRGRGPLAAAFQATAGSSLDTTFEYVHSWLGVPLAVKGNVVGMISLDHRETDYYTDQHCRLALAFANQVAVTLENARLYRAAEKRADEAQTLFNVQQAITSRLEREELLQLIADEARRLTGAQRAAILMLNDDVQAALEMTVLSGYPDGALLGYQVPLHGSLTGHALREGRAFRSNGGQNGTPLYEEIVRRTGSRSLLAVPFAAGDRPSGVIVVADEDAGGFDDDDERIVQMLASGAVIALENADLFEAEHERRRVAESLRDVLSRLNASLPLPETLLFIVEQAMRVLGASAGIVFSVDHEKNLATVEAIAGMPDELSHHRTLPLLETAANQATMHAEPFTVPNLAVAMAEEADLLAAYDPENRAWIEGLEKHFGAYLSVPIIAGSQVYGDITLYYPAPRHFSDEELSLAASYGEQTSLAVENARLRQQAEQSAASAERSRLARDLHDAVTQTLFSASLIAEVLPRLWERNQEMGQQRLEELRELTRGALAEMRTLLLELRPAALTESSLPELLRQLSEAVIGRSRLDVDLTVKGARDLPPEVQVALYRIAQECLNNVTKHAAASHVTVALSLDGEAVTLAITDDGRGFDPDAIPPNSLGLGIMRERVNDIGATMTIASAAGEGTTVRVRWMPPVPEGAPADVI